VLGHLGSRWAVLVLHALAEGPLRYYELLARLAGVSDTMLTSTLRTLTGDGLVHRTVVPAAPPQVHYALTGLGEGATTAMTPLLDWIRDNAGSPHWRGRGRAVVVDDDLSGPTCGGTRLQEEPRVVVLRGGEDADGRALLLDSPLPHDQDPAADAGHDAQVMRDHQQGPGPTRPASG
jgi:DNA-binding HxlR family transcriptional regulator